MSLSGIDFFIVLLYLGGMLFLGSFFKKYVHSSQDYFLGGKMLPFWAIGMSIVVSDIGAIDFVGATGQAYRYGLVVANFDWIGSMPAMMLAAFIFIPYYWRAGVYTIPEYLGKRYNDSVRTIEALIWVVFMAFNLGIIFWASAVLLNTLMGWSIGVSLMVTAIVVGFYTVSGGLSAVVMTDVVQMIIMFVGGFAVIFLGLWKLGGWSGLVEKIHALGPQYSAHFTLFLPTNTTTPYPWTGILFGLTFVLAPAYFIGNQAIVQRTLGARDEWNAKAGVLWGSFFKFFIPALIVLPGLIALPLFPGLTNGDEAFPMLIRHLLPPGLTGLVFAAFFAALMSSVDSYLNSAATLWTKDIYQKFIKKDADDRHLLRMGRLFTVVFLIIGVATAPLNKLFPGMYVYVQTLLSFFQGPTLAILLLGMLWSRITQWGGLAGLGAGVCFSVAMYIFKGNLFTIDDPFLYISWWSFLGAAIVTVLVSYFSSPEPLEKLHGLVYRLVTKDDDVQQLIQNRLNHD
ncbi:sodium/glucose cotransporter [bacterium BMS3Abin05]|nr:sodium/glucose cotransporter [bacterium BMS3Abin05]GBE27002.1 sodium/glucose cotransporter [bacterium BMS3Bbin03]HDZ11584.1 sodium transporter [Bacteroidota bacterium]